VPLGHLSFAEARAMRVVVVVMMAVSFIVLLVSVRVSELDCVVVD